MLTGLALEARLAKSLAGQMEPASPEPIIRCAAASTARAIEEAEALCRHGVAALLSFGLAGGLDPSLPSGSVILALEIRTASGKALACDATWQERIMAKASGLTLIRAPLAAAARPLTGSNDKARLFAASKAAAVDMESLALAEAAAAAGLPFLALRAVADAADRNLPTAALAPLSHDGRAQPLYVIGRLARRPWELPALVRLGRDAGHAERALAGLSQIAAPLFRGF